MPENQPGSGGGTPNNPGDGSGAGNNPSITEDKINEMINAALASRDKRLQKNITETIFADESPFMQKFSELSEKIESNQKNQSSLSNQNTSSNSNKNNNANSNNNSTNSDSNERNLSEEAQKKLSEYESRLEKMQKQLQQREEQIAKAENEKIEKSRREILKSQLEEQGIKSRASAVMAQHILDGTVKWDAKDGEVGAPVVEKDGLEIPYSQWLQKDFSKSDSGKLFLDDAGREGSGSGVGDNAVYRGVNTNNLFGGKDPDQMSEKELNEAFEQSKSG